MGSLMWPLLYRKWYLKEVKIIFSHVLICLKLKHCLYQWRKLVFIFVTYKVTTFVLKYSWNGRKRTSKNILWVERALDKSLKISTKEKRTNFLNLVMPKAFVTIYVERRSMAVTRKTAYTEKYVVRISNIMIEFWWNINYFFTPLYAFWNY